jgi:YfiH family protein
VIEQQQGTNLYFQFDHFSQYQAMAHAVFSRQGGLSAAPYLSLNTGLSVGDDRETVFANRRLLSEALKCADWPLATSWIVHGDEVIEVGAEWKSDHDQLHDPGYRRRADALMTEEPGIFLLISFADCLPVMYFDPVHRVAAMAHAGWRGTSLGIAGKTVRALAERFGSRPADLLVGLAPCIGPCCYEVGPDVLEAFEHSHLTRTLVTQPSVRGNVDHWMLDLKETNRLQLLDAGVAPDHIEMMPFCTGCRTDLFFSHRCEQGKTGRFAVLVGLNAD